MKTSKPPEIQLMSDEGIDHFMDGRLKLIQSNNGYRFSIDAIFLAQFVTIKPNDIVLELGTGCGIILLALLLTKPVAHTFGLEIQDELASQAARNVCLNGFEDKMDIIQGDIKNPPLMPQMANVVICIPPYRPVKSGRINPDQRRAIARHEIKASLDKILYTAKKLLKKKGRLALIYPSERLVEVLVRLRRLNLEPKRIQNNYPTKNSKAKLTLIEATLGGKPGMEIDQPLLGQGNWDHP